MIESECLSAIANLGVTARDILLDAMPDARRRFNKIDRDLVALLADVRRHFPDAQFYTASGGFNLMIGHAHDHYGRIPQQQLLALSGNATIGDGDF